MRRGTLAIVALLALIGVATASAQSVSDVRTFDSVDRRSVSHRQLQSDAVVARLMSFDRNHDGRISAAELPERMRGVFTRANMTADEALAPADVLRLAQTLPADVAAPGLEVGRYGFGESSGFDTRMRINAAIEDLRLAGATRTKALDIGRQFIEASSAKARADLRAAVAASLTPRQAALFNAELNRPAGNSVLDRVVAEGSETLKATVARSQALSRHAALVRLVNQFGLRSDRRGRMMAALEELKPQDRLSSAGRTRLVEQLRGVLTPQQRNDFRAALERRPIVKQEEVTLTGVSGVGFGSGEVVRVTSR
jgi:hypothetical protein